MTDEKIKKMKQKKKNLNLDEFIILKPEERKAIIAEAFDDAAQIDDIEKAISVFPEIDIKVDYFVEGEKEIAVGDVLTIKINITQLFLKDGEEAGFIHSNKFPFLKKN